MLQKTAATVLLVLASPDDGKAFERQASTHLNLAANSDRAPWGEIACSSDLERKP